MAIKEKRKKKEDGKFRGDFDGTREEVKNPHKRGYHKGCFGNGQNHCLVKSGKVFGGLK